MSEPIGLDKHDPAGMAAWLRERGENTRTFLALTSDQQRLQFLERWQQNVLPHLAFRFGQAADMVEEQSREIQNLRADLAIQSVNAKAVLDAQAERDDLRVRLREAIDLVKLNATTSHMAWIREVMAEIATDDATVTTKGKTNDTQG